MTEGNNCLSVLKEFTLFHDNYRIRESLDQMPLSILLSFCFSAFTVAILIVQE
jgi:hypothetical protein